MPKSFRLIIHRDLCKSCGLCLRFCAKKLLKLDSKLNRRGVHPVTLTAEGGQCTGCGNCATMCPDAAIEIKEVPEAAEASAAKSTKR